MSAKTISTILLILGLAGVVTAQENPVLSLRILEKLNPVEVRIQIPAGTGVWSEVKLSRGQLWVNGKAQKRASWGTPCSTFKIKVQNLVRDYQGRITVTTRLEKEGLELFILNQVALEDYAACVVANESAYDQTQPEYLKALGVVVRLYAAHHLGRHPGYDLCDLSHCQVYQGLPPHFAFWKGMIQSGKDFRFPTSVDPKSLYFHRCCGGILESADQIWGGPASPSRTGPDEVQGRTLCQDDHFFRWTSSASVQNIEATFKAMVHLPPNTRLKSLDIAEKTLHGRAKTFLAIFGLPNGETKKIRENVPRFVSAFGKSYGWRVFPSVWFDIQRDGNLFKFSGRGLGHGVGLCQSGALKLAQTGWTWREILGFYFPCSNSI